MDYKILFAMVLQKVRYNQAQKHVRVHTHTHGRIEKFPKVVY